MRLLFRVAHILLVLVLSSLLIYSVYYAFAILAEDQQHSSPQSVQADSGLDTDDVSRKPSPQEIVRIYQWLHRDGHVLTLHRLHR